MSISRIAMQVCVMAVAVVVAAFPAIAADGDGDTQAYFAMKFEKHGIAVHTNATVTRIEGIRAFIQSGNGEIQVPFGTVVFAVGAEPNDGLGEELEASGLKVVKIGDCTIPRRIIDAVREGFEAGRAA